MNAAVRCRACRRPVVIVTARLFEWPKYAAGLIDAAADRHAAGCGPAALADIHRVWTGGRL